MSYDDDVVGVLIMIAFVAWLFVQAWVWWPTARTYCMALPIEYRFDDFPETLLYSACVLTPLYAIAVILLSIIWPFTIGVALIFAGLHLIRMQNKLKQYSRNSGQT